MRAQGPALKEFASKQTRERPMLVAGSLLALTVLPMAAFMTRKVLTRPHTMAALEVTMPRNQEWYTGE